MSIACSFLQYPNAFDPIFVSVDGKLTVSMFSPEDIL